MVKIPVMEIVQRAERSDPGQPKDAKNTRGRLIMPNHGIILHEEYRERMKSLSPERLGYLIHNMFLVDDGLEPIKFVDDEALDVMSEFCCERLKRDLALSEKQRNNRLGKTKQEPKKTKKNQTETKSKSKQTPITNNQLPITNIKNIYGTAQNVLLTDEEFSKIKARGYEELIEELSLYMASKNKKYADHYATVLAWGRKRDKESTPIIKTNQFTSGATNTTYDFKELESKLVKN